LIAGTRFYERREVKDIIAYLRLIYNPGDQVSLHRIINVPVRGIGHRSLTGLVRWAHNHSVPEYQALKVITSGNHLPFKPRTTKALLSFYHLIEELIQRSQELNLLGLIDLLIERVGYHHYLLSKVNGEERWENILELRTVAEEYQYMAPLVGLRSFLEEVALISDADSYEETTNAVTLITLHQAKGLEFPIVFIVGLEDGILPHIKSFGDMEQIEEERRLCYVGVTRAMQKVYLLRAFRRNLMGGSTINKPSRFLKDIPNHLIAADELWHDRNNGPITAVSCNLMKARSSEVPQLMVGDHVSHDRFGDGTVISIQALNGDAEVVIAFVGFGIKKLLLSYANLKKVNH
jgi:DNA helicase-2/ATP-dependent DNA helicase PcrA